MPAYVISEVEVLDEASVAAYKPLAKQSIIDHGGTYLARDAVPEALEGAFAARQRIVMIRFDTVEDARRWYASDAYTEAIAAANGGLDRRLFVFEGL